MESRENEYCDVVFLENKLRSKFLCFVNEEIFHKNIDEIFLQNIK